MIAGFFCRILILMKRILLHLLFWTLYMVQDTLLSYLWEGARLQHLPMQEQVIMAIGNSTVYLLPKLLFTYFVLYVVLDNILRDRKQLWKNILYIVLALVFTLFIFRLDAKYINPHFIYHDILPVPAFFSPLGFLANLMDLGFVAGAAIFIRQLRLQLAGKRAGKNTAQRKAGNRIEISEKPDQSPFSL